MQRSVRELKRRNVPIYEMTDNERREFKEYTEAVKTVKKALFAAGVGLAATGLVAGLIALGTLLTLLVWNVGIVEVARACGGGVSTIGFWTALAINVGLNIIKSTFRAAQGKPAIEIKTK